MNGIVVFQSDFGLADGAVSAMHGVALGVDRELLLEDLTHEIPPFDVWSGAYRLLQAAPYWPAGTVFVSVVDPGVGTDRRSVVLRTESGHLFVSPDNGSLDLVARELGIGGVREIDEAVNRREHSERSYTFHGRDVYAYTGARLASGAITFEEVGQLLEPEVVALGLEPAHRVGAVVHGSIPVLDARFGNVWTDVGRELFTPPFGEPGVHLHVVVLQAGSQVWAGTLPVGNSFGDVVVGEELAYWNSLERLALGVNQGSFAERHGIGSGAGWTVEIREVDAGASVR